MKTLMKWRTQYNIEQDLQADRNTAIRNFGPSKTIQDAPDSDLAELLTRFGYKDGSNLPTSLGNIDLSHYGDYSETVTLKDALDINRNAKDLFRTLPAKLRAKFANNPFNMLEWVHDPDNAEEAVKIGLLTKMPEREKNTPVEVIITNQPENTNDATRNEGTDPPDRGKRRNM